MFRHMRDGIMRPDVVDPAAAGDPGRRAEINKAAADEIYAYFSDLVDQRRATPSDDVISGFLAHEVDGDRLSKEDILDVCLNFFLAGLDTVSSTLTCFFAFLARHPDHRRQIVDDPDVISAAVEELLRWETPVTWGVPRVVREDVELPNGCMVKAGAIVRTAVGAANVADGAVENPFEVRFDRLINPHLAFGGGPHRCLGSHLARRELRIALREWHSRIPEYRLKPGHEELHYPRGGVRSVQDLMLSWR
jgi:cytochrome P450